MASQKPVAPWPAPEPTAGDQVSGPRVGGARPQGAADRLLGLRVSGGACLPEPGFPGDARALSPRGTSNRPAAAHGPPSVPSQERINRKKEPFREMSDEEESG